MRNPLILVPGLALVALLSACGGNSLDRPESLPRRTYSAGTTRITVVMTSCGDTCVEYTDHACDVSVDADEKRIELSPTVSYSDKDGVDRDAQSGCNLECGSPVFVHCDTPALSAGSWTVDANGFDATIEVR